jgi:hypothetical protein
MDREQRVESSVPVQGRISIVTLAELNMYWESAGADIRTMSQLLSWSVDALRDILANSGKLPQVIESVVSAHNHLEERKLYQSGLRQRSEKKIINAMAFEGLRVEGIDPKIYAEESYGKKTMIGNQYRTMHNSNSVRPLEAEVRMSQEDVRREWRKEQILKRALEADDRIQRERLAEELKVAQNSIYCIKDEEPLKPGEGFKEGMSDEDLIEYNRKRDKAELARINAPMSEEDRRNALVK